MGKKILKISLIFIAFLILGFIIAFGLYIFQVYRTTKAEQKSLAGQILLGGQKFEVSTKDDYWFGSANPRVTIIEFSDFACTNSKSTFPRIREIVTLYKKDVRVVFKDFPQFDESLGLALGARCAGEQGLFWLMHDKLFEHQGITGEDAILEAAKQIGADEKRFKKCFEETKYLEQIKNNIIDADRIGIDGTPTWIINGYMVKGDIPLVLWDNLIKRLLKQN